MKKSDVIQGSIYDSMAEFEDFKEVGSDDEDEFKSAIEKTELLVMENYHNYINQFLNGEYQSNKFEILIINEIKYNMTEKAIDIKEIFINLNYIVILLYIKLSTQIKYFLDTKKPLFTTDDIIDPDDIEENLNVNLEKKLNDYELQLFKKLDKKNKNINNNDNNDEGNGDEVELNSNIDSIEFSEEEKNKEEGMKININFISFKLYNILKNTQRFDTNVYFYTLFLDIVYPNLSKKEKDNIYIPLEQQSLYNIISKDYVEFILSDMNIIYYNISNTKRINIVFQELLLKYWNYVVIQYNNTSKKNDINDNPNVTISLSSTMDIIMDFSDKVIINLEKNILDDLLSFNNKFLYGLSMYQIFDKFCGDLYKNKLINLFDLFGLKNHYLALNQLNIEEGHNKYMANKISKNEKELQEIKKEINNKPFIYIGGRIASCVINLNKNGTFEEKEGNLIKLKLVNLGLNFEMFSDNDNNNNDNNNKKEKEKEKEPIYNNISISINNIFFLIKENPIPIDDKPKYYNLFSKNKISKCESIDYFNMSFKYRNIKKTRDDDIIIEEDEDDLFDDIKNGEISSQKNEDLKKKDSKFEVKSSKIVLDNKTKEYIAFLLNNQVKLDNMEMVIDITLTEMIVDSFYHNLNQISSSLSDFYIDFTNKKPEENIEGGIYVNPTDLIPLCEDRLMIIKCDFNINNLLIDIFLKEDKDQKKWMRLFFICENFKFAFNENGMFLIMENNYIHSLKDFNYILHIIGDKDLNKNNISDIEDKISDINKEDSYLKRLGYVELYYSDKIELNKKEKELNLNLGNNNIFFCEDSFDFVFEFQNVFVDNYLDKIKNIFSHETLNSDDDDNNEENDNKNLINEKNIKNEEKEEKEEKKGDNKKEFSDDFEILDDDVIFYESKDNKQNNKKYESKYLKKNANSLTTILEENKKNDYDDFMIIETKTSYEKKILRKKKEEECVKYLIQLQSLHLYFFSGYDFNFQDDIKKDLDLSSNSNKEEIDNNNNDIFYGINRNYLLKYRLSKNEIHKKVLQTKKRIKNEERDYNNYILLNIINFSFLIIDYSYYDIVIDNFFIDDFFEKSEYKRIISKHDYTNETAKFFLCKIESIKNKENKNYKDVTDLTINIIIPSIDIFLDQLPLTFIIKFILSRNYDNKNNEDTMYEEKVKISDNNSENDKDKEKNNDKKNDNDDDDVQRVNSKDSWNDEEIEKMQSITYVNYISINSFGVNIHYNSHKLSIKKLYSNKDWMELLNVLADIKELNLKFKKYTKSIPTQLPETISDLISFWKDDIMQNQIIKSSLRGITITRPFLKLYDGVIDLVRQPYKSYKKNEGIQKGIQKGMKNFLFSFSSQGLFFGEKIFRGIRVVTFRKSGLSLKKKSLYKTWVYKIKKDEYDYEKHYYK